jgi:hypothetical protein
MTNCEFLTVIVLFYATYRVYSERKQRRQLIRDISRLLEYYLDLSRLYEPPQGLSPAMREKAIEITKGWIKDIVQRKG